MISIRIVQKTHKKLHAARIGSLGIGLTLALAPSAIAANAYGERASMRDIVLVGDSFFRPE